MTPIAKTTFILKSSLTIVVLLNIAFWFYAREIKAQWLNVPPVPSMLSATSPTLGDTQFASRVISIMIQNLGNTGGRITPIKNYDFEKLGEWFMLHHSLDSHSDIVPYMAAHYFSASQDPTKIRPVIDYLRVAGNSAEGEKWRWLAQAAYLSRFKLKDLDLALEIAQELSVLPNDNVPEWARHLTVNVLNQRGEKEAALQLMLSLLKDKADTLDPAEINSMKYYICEQILDLEEAKSHSLCEDVPLN